MLVLLPYLEYSISIKIHCCLSHNKSARVFVQSPNSVGLPSENITLKSVDGYTIVAYFIKQPPDRVDKTCTMLYCHGNAGNIGHRLHNAQALYQHCGVNILLVEYRGYGKSEGTPSELGKCYVYVYISVCMCTSSFFVF